MVLLAAGIEKSQAEIAADVQQDWWGTTPDIIVAYLSRFLTGIGVATGSSLREVGEHLGKGRAVILDWWDDLDGGEADGHYSLAAGIDPDSRRITLADPSQAREGIWEMSVGEFERRWYDYLDENRRIKVERGVIWADPRSRR